MICHQLDAIVEGNVNDRPCCGIRPSCGRNSLDQLVGLGPVVGIRPRCGTGPHCESFMYILQYVEFQLQMV